MNASSASSFVPPRRKRRPALACEECRRRKIRCDRHSPCAPCRKANLPSCHYVSDDRVGSAKAPFEAGETQFSVFEQTLAGLVSLDPGTTTAPVTPITQGSKVQHPRPLQQQQQQHQQQHQQRQHQLHRQNEPFEVDLQQVYWHSGPLSLDVPMEQSPVDMSLDDSPFLDMSLTDPSFFEMSSDGRASWEAVSQTNTSTTEPNEPMELYPSLSRAPVGAFYKGRFLAQSHWINYAHGASEVLTAIRSREANLSDHYHEQWTFSRCKSIRKSIKEREAIAINRPCIPIGSMIPERAVSDQLVQAYLRTFHAVLTVLHVPTFLRDYSNHWRSPNSSSQPFIVMLLLVLSIGSRFVSKEVGLSRILTLRWIKTASDWLLSSKQRLRLSLDGLRVQCLLLMARMVHGVTYGSSCFCAGSLYCTAMSTNLSWANKEDDRDDPQNETEARRRLMATIVELDLQTSMDGGSLPITSVEDSHFSLPSNTDDVGRGGGADEDVPQDTAAFQPKPMNQFTQSSLQILLAKTLPVRLKVARFLNSQHEYSFDTALGLSAQLLGELKECYDLIEGYRTASTPPTPFQIRLFDLLMRRFVLSLHHPFALKAVSDPRYAYSRQLCIDTSMDLLAHLVQPDELKSTTGTGSVFSAVYLQSALYLTGEITSQIDTSTYFMSTSRRSDAARREIRANIDRFRQIAMDRIAGGETNIKICVLVSCLLAQAEAKQEGASVQTRISLALEQTLEKCGSLLEAQLKTLTDTRSIDIGTGNNKNQNGWLHWEKFLDLGKEEGSEDRGIYI